MDNTKLRIVFVSGIELSKSINYNKVVTTELRHAIDVVVLINITTDNNIKQ